MKALKVTFGKTVCAYATATVDASRLDVDNRQALADLANNTVFAPDWDTAEDLRVISAVDADGNYLVQDMSLESDSSSDGEVIMAGSLQLPGAEVLEVEFSVRRGATQDETDLAFLQALAQIANINYLAIGEEGRKA